MVTEAIILAGGLGTRLRTLVPNLPKPMAPVSGRPFLEYNLDLLSRQGIRRVFLSVGYGRRVIMECFGSSYRGMKIDYVIEDEPLGTGGALRESLWHARTNPVVVMNGDTFLEFDLAGLEDFHTRRRSPLTLTLKHLPETGRYGRVVVEGEKVKSFEEKASGGEGLINAGVYMIDRRTGWLLGDYGRRFSLEDDFLVHMTDDAYAYLVDGYFIDIGVPEDYLRAQTELEFHAKGGR